MDLSKYRIFILIVYFISNSSLSWSQTFQFHKSDTINRTDTYGKKHGKWIEFFVDNASKIEKEGLYENNRKTGIWKTYFLNGNLKSEITYKNNQPDGYAKIYYENGKLSEEGIWKGTMWVGSYNYYHATGVKAYEWSFNENGKRSGIQKYYYENGKLLIKGEWIEGKENGTITEYFEDGSIKSEKKFDAGQFNSETSKFYNNKEVAVKEVPVDTSTTVKKNPEVITKTENTSQAFNGNGTHKLYNAFKKIDREGLFKNGQLVDGKRYYYNSDGVLLKTVIYKNGTVSETIKEK